MVAVPVVAVGLGRGVTLPLGRAVTLAVGRTVPPAVERTVARTVGRTVARTVGRGVNGRWVPAGRGFAVGAGRPGMIRVSPALERPARRIGW